MMRAGAAPALGGAPARRVVVCGAAALLCAGVIAQPACARQQEQAATSAAAELYATGRYDEAIAALQHAPDAASRSLLVRTLLEVGHYDEAVSAALGGGAPDAVPIGLANAAGEALYARGRRAEAESLFDRAAQPDAPETLRARLNRAVAMWERGARDDALREFDTFVDIYNANRARSAADLTAVATAVRYLGTRDPQLFQDAVRAYEEAGAADRRFAESRILEGELFLEKYNSTEASALFREVLDINPRHPRALLGLARARAFDGTDEAMAFADSSLAINPNAPDARAFRARLLLGLERYDDAAAEAERALAVNAASVPALAMLGAVRYLRGDTRGHDELRQRALALNPRSAEFDVTVADMAAQQRRYAVAVAMAQRGLELEETSWSAHALVGLTQLRLGDAAAARASLEAAFAGDPYNVWVKNTLDLLDTYPRYRTVSTERFELFLHGDEADLLAIYMAELAEEAYDALAQRYGARPRVPVRIEVYPRHADFSVRTVGLAGLGALGVAFGNILAMDSPSAREIGAFNWGATLWHEIAHAVTLEASNQQVPRWLTEGISVYEERRARAGWGEDLRLDFVALLAAGRTLPVSELNSGFVRPTYPGQVMHAYYQASLVVEMIEQDHGVRALRDMLTAYGRGRTTEQVLREVLRTDAASFDRRFDEYMRRRFATQLAAVTAELPAGATADGGRIGGEFLTAMDAARAAYGTGRIDDAVRLATRATSLFPEYSEANSAYHLLYRIHHEAGDRRAAAAALSQQVERNSSDYDAHVQLAALLDELGDARAAADVLERAMYIHPFDPQLHQKMAELYAVTGQHGKVVRERRALVALNPVNRADALYRLALALQAAGDRDEARRQVLRSLEIAPNFLDAQTLLLELRGGTE